MITKVRREPRGSAVPNRQRRTRPTRKPFRRHFIWSGNWDQEARPFTEHPLYIDFLEVFEAKFEYRTTRAYAKRVEAIHRGRPYSQVPLGKASAEPLDTLAKIDFYFEERIKLIHSMMQEGYRSQQELGGVQSEIGVAVGRNGELLKWTNGRNRLVAAKIARVPKVFVGVDFVHRLWVERCMERYPMSPLVAIRSGLRDLERGGHGVA